MGLQENLVKETYACGFENSFAIQHMAFLLFCKGLEVNQHVQSGTGFTESHQKVSCNSRIKVWTHKDCKDTKCRYEIEQRRT
ncbi:eukaryotic initiation factor 4A-13-like isoform X1 [Nicotiana tomentosiformis]|uniref:eukaryotic initiation factor 4A-13-like isoform X1 n=1 Tax=Nicotiana tomentosiformis TaxID=4098 RepID=UPI00388CECB7